MTAESPRDRAVRMTAAIMKNVAMRFTYSERRFVEDCQRQAGFSADWFPQEPDMKWLTKLFRRSVQMGCHK